MMVTSRLTISARMSVRWLGGGDGIAQAGVEACDDGNAFDNDKRCLTNCQPSRCGDGVRRQDIGPGQNGYEECDDGNQSNGDGCSNDCRLNN